MKFDHVTAVVDDADRAAEIMGRLVNAPVEARVDLPGMVIRSLHIGEGELHLCAPAGQGPVQDHHRRHGPGYHHVALRVGNLDATLVDLGWHGFRALGEPVQTAPGLREVFLDRATTGGLLIQLVERKADGGDNEAIEPHAVARLADSL
jgi:methylmalonyl-CoA/ethylmalonyl-CoA epimerase